MPPEDIDSLNADTLKGLVLSLLAKIDDHVGQNNALLARIDELLARIAELEGRAGKPPKTPTNSSLPPWSGHKANVADAKKKGRKGHPGVTRELCANPDVTRDVHVERCACGAKLPAAEQVLARAYDHVELPPIKPVTTRVNLHRADCPCCGKTTTAEPPADMPPGSPFGPGIVALVTYLHGCQMVGYARLAEMLKGLFGLKISEGAIANMLARAAEPFAECAQTIHETVRSSPVIASDETSARVKGKTHWQWTFVTATAVAHLIAPTRDKMDGPERVLSAGVTAAALADNEPQIGDLAGKVAFAEQHQNEVRVRLLARRPSRTRLGHLAEMVYSDDAGLRPGSELGHDFDQVAGDDGVVLVARVSVAGRLAGGIEDDQPSRNPSYRGPAVKARERLAGWVRELGVADPG
jgi:transposase